MDRVRRVASQQAMEGSIDEFVTRGYKLQTRGEEYAHLREVDRGEAEIHFIIAALTLWWSFGLGNALYAIYSHVNAEEVLLVLEDADRPLSQIRQAQSRTREQSDRSGVSQTTSTESGPSVSLPAQFGLQLISLLTVAMLLVVLDRSYTGTFDSTVALLVLVGLAGAIILRYVTIHHTFQRRVFQIGWLLVGGAVYLGAMGATVRRIGPTGMLASVPENIPTTPQSLDVITIAPDQLVMAIFTIGGILMLLGAVVEWDVRPLLSPPGIRQSSLSPIWFGTVCLVIGLWAVLFVGFRLQRVLLVAPIFEELLKFGVAILIGGALFGRSTAARLGVALIVGSLFGIIEHVTTYPTETDLLYLFRILFHMTTTVLSVSAYSVFAREDHTELLVLAPVLSMLIHFFNNAFAVLGGVTIAVIFEINPRTLGTAYGTGAVVLTTSLILIALLRRRLLIAIHQPIRDVLAHLY